jgi:hypothetical protein
MRGTNQLSLCKLRKQDYLILVNILTKPSSPNNRKCLCSNISLSPKLSYLLRLNRNKLNQYKQQHKQCLYRIQRKEYFKQE